MKDDSNGEDWMKEKITGRLLDKSDSQDRIMGAAAEMLEALEAVLIGVTSGPVEPWLAKVKKAVRKARGE